MNAAGLAKRLAPLAAKLRGQAHLCPWRSVAFGLDPRTLGANPPPLQIEIVTEEGAYRKVRFGSRHEAWFPREAPITPEMWSEYLAVFWDHPVNGHRYHREGTLVEKGDICIDCGACEGFFALRALELGAGQVVCLEPYPIMADCLRATLANEMASGRATVLEAALGAVNGKASFASDEQDFFAGKLGGDSSKTSSVRLMILGQVCRELSLEQVDFIKMDIEGAELQALDGAIPVLQQYHPKLAITTYHRAFDFAALKALLGSIGYDHIVPAGLTQFFGETFRPVMLHAWNDR